MVNKRNWDEQGDVVCCCGDRFVWGPSSTAHKLWRVHWTWLGLGEWLFSLVLLLYEDLLIKYPPVILLGTHYDELLKTGDKYSAKSLNWIDKILSENINFDSLVPLLSTFTSSSSTTNEIQYSCCWLVHNSNPQDINILKLQQLLLDTAFNDVGFDVSQEVRISMLQTMDNPII